MRDLTYPPVIVAATTAFRLLGVRFDLRGAEHVPRSGGAVLALNHVSYVDFVFGGYAALPSRRLVRFMAKRELFAHRLTGPLMRSLHHIEVDRADGRASYELARHYLAAGEVVGVFPEATISRSFELKEFKTGATRLAADGGVPLIPAVLWGTQRMLTKDHPRDFSRGRAIAITVGEPLHPSGVDPVAETAELRKRMAATAGRVGPALPRAPARRVVAAGLVRRVGADARAGRAARRRGAGGAAHPARGRLSRGQSPTVPSAISRMMSR